MDLNFLFQTLVSTLLVVGGWFLNVIWNANKELANKVQAIELLVAGQYVNKSEFREFSERLMNKLDRIEEKVEKKVDK